MKAIICAGGTGGHIYPALAIINKIKEKEPNSEILYIGNTDRMEAELIPKLGIDFIGIEMLGLNRKNIFKNINVLIKYGKALKKAKQIIKSFDPDIVIGAGGYITAPVIIAAHKLNYKTVIHEQNSVFGVSNKFLSKYVDKICVSLKDTKLNSDNNKIVYTGNPRSEEVMGAKPILKKMYNLDEKKKLVVIVMGSLGSTTMIKKIKDIIPEVSNKDYEIMIITGKKYYEELNDNKNYKNIFIVPFVENFVNLLKKTDLIVSRAGASTISEITAIGLPAILVPSPYVTNNHQYKNAKELEVNGACKLIKEEDFSANTIIPIIDELLNNETLYNKMSNASKKMGVSDSATKFYQEIKKIMKEDNNE